MPYGFRVITRVERPNAELVQCFSKLHTPDISDVMFKAGTVDRRIYPVYLPMKRVVGTAITVSVPSGSFNVIKAGMQQTQAGDVLVMTAYGDCNLALMGGNVCRGLLHRGVTGLVMDGAVRDVSEIREDGLPVYARGIATADSPMEGEGEVNIPIACGGVVVNPGDIIVGDEDGIVVVAPRFAKEIAEAVAQLEAKHAAIQDVLLRGEVTNVANIETRLREQGCEFI